MLTLYAFTYIGAMAVGLAFAIAGDHGCSATSFCIAVAAVYGALSDRDSR